MRKSFLVLIVLLFSFNAAAQFFREFTPGYYYNTNGEKITGLIHMNIWEDHILYKIDKDASKQKIKIADIRSVIYYSDSLSVKTYKKDKYYFAKMALNGPIKLFYKFDQYPSNTTSPNMRTFSRLTDYSSGNIYGDTKKQPMFENGDMTDELTKKNFIEVMSKILVHYPETVKSIQTEKLKFKDLGDIVEKYFYGHLE